METLAAYRDDGPLGELVRTITGRMNLPSTPLALLAVAALGVGLAIDRGRPGAPTAVGLAVCIVSATTGTMRPQRLAWLTPPALRLAEFGFVVVLAAGEPAAAPAAFCLLAAIAFHHYDVVYRLRHQKLAPPSWLQRLGLGWPGRMSLLLLFVLGDVLGTAALAMAAVLGVLFVSESVASWVRLARDSSRTLAMATEEEEDG